MAISGSGSGNGHSRNSSGNSRKLHVFTNIPNPYNGHLYSAMAAADWEVYVTYKGPPASAGRPWKIDLDGNERIAGSLREEWREVRRCEDEERQVILTGGYAGAVEWLRRRLAHRQRLPLVSFWGERLCGQSPVRDLLRESYLRPIRTIFAVGSWAVESYKRVAPQAAVHVLPYTTGVPFEHRRYLTQPTIGFAGSLIRRKGIDILIRGLSELSTQERPILEIAGSGPEATALGNLSIERGVTVRWLGELDRAGLLEAQSRWWAQAVPSRYDGWGVVVSEALSAGVPVLTSKNVGAGVDLVRNGVNGEVVDSEDGWGAALLRAVNEEWCLRCGHAAQVIGREFAADRAASWLQEILSGHLSGQERSFVSESWRRIGKILPGAAQ